VFGRQLGHPTVRLGVLVTDGEAAGSWSSRVARRAAARCPVVFVSMNSREDQPTLRQRFTPLQGRYLSFIRMYSLIHRQPPAEADMQRFFRVTPPSVHRMVLALEQRGLLERVPGKARSIRVLVSPEELPPLEEAS